MRAGTSIARDQKLGFGVMRELIIALATSTIVATFAAAFVGAALWVVYA